METNKYTFNHYVKASHIWSGADDYIDFGEREYLVRGYNIELKKLDGTTFWESACWFGGVEPEDYYNSDYYLWHYDEIGAYPTGRICFRGYGREEYDTNERDYFIHPVQVFK